MKDPAFVHPEDLLPWYVNGTLEGDEARRVEAHLRACVSCRRQVAELRDLRRLVRESPTPDGELDPAGLERLLDAVGDEQARPGVPRSTSNESTSGTGGTGSAGSPRRRAQGGDHRARILGSLAATVLLAVGLGSVVLRSPPPGPPVERASGEDDGLRSALDPAVALPVDDFVLRWHLPPEWTSRPGASQRGDCRFSIDVTTTGLQPVASADGLLEPSFRVPPARLRDLAGQRLLWRVEAVRADGARSESPTFVATVASGAAGHSPDLD